MTQFSRFLVVGVLNTLLGYSIIFACMHFGKMTPETSNISGYAVGLIVSYILNRNFTFNGKLSRRGEIIRFLVAFIISYASNFVVLLILIHSIGIHEGVSQVLAGVAYVFVSYLMNKYFVFQNCRELRLN